MRAKSSFFLVVASVLIGGLFPISSHAAETCLAQLPDSAWSNGAPNSSVVTLNRDVVLTKVVVTRNADNKELPRSIPTYGIADIIPKYLNNTHIEYIWKRDFKQISYPVTVIYEYQGANCQKRTIKGPTGSVTYRPYNSIEISDVAGIQNALQSQSDGNFLVIRESMDQIALLAKYIESTKNNPLKISTNIKPDDYTFAWWLGLEKYTYPLVFGYPALRVTSEDNCLINNSSKIESVRSELLIKMSTIEKSFIENPLVKDKLAFRPGAKTCKLTVSFPITSKQMYDKNVDYVRVNGYVWVENNSPVGTPAQAAKTTINCIRDKSVNKVTGLKPRCPSGFVIKK